MQRNDLKPATIAAHAAGAVDLASGGVVPPIQPSTTFVRDRDYQLVNEDNVYLRSHNDAVRLGEEILSRLEGAEDTQLFPSGMAAIAAVFRTVPNGGAVIVQSGIYWGTTKWIRDFCSRRDITLHEVDASDTGALQALCAGLKAQLVFVETPSNPWLKTVDIIAAKACAESCGAFLVVDSTAATPLLTQPLALGADLVMHSATKVINGHSDVLGGVLSTRVRTPVWEAICMDRNEAGAVMGPFEAWLLVRSMRTLPLRVEKMCANAMAVAEFLAAHPEVEEVLYPGLPSHEGHDLAGRQMQGGYGFLMSFLVKGGRAAALAVAGRLNLFHRATSLGGVESLVEHRHTIEPHTGIPENLLRISIGIEDIDDLIADLSQALQGG
ncbi:trans-sulfuration enzyme family protein [Pseudophaeobacter flagellatus]|uniref:trans-sulfuration enzyme family protein n=1 Tax=Pseudophaeobacter flagellatus TaxID=2899119 RepID=UPI001E477F9B|nr:aminotransferase class I/II-fold pyridoxal phosphate-dependent enzyme [Pseudophaeobacter flagellatus]MCD9149690.1 aminotransferase class I/II-fold pyridoxal phosphate-dependent enzyme [Pseudophaeobacter flagellatus]